MDNIIFSLASLIILVPIIYFLPLGFTKKGRLIIIGISILCAIFGILSTITLPFWQVGLLTLLLVYLISFILDSRLEGHIYTNNKFNQNDGKPKESDDNPKQSILSPQHFINKPNQSSEDLINIGVETSPHILNILNDSNQKEEIINTFSVEELIGNDIVDDAKDVIKRDSNVMNKLTVEKKLDSTVLEEEYDDDIDFLLNRESLDDEDINLDYTKIPDEQFGYMSDIELILENELLDKEFINKKDQHVDIEDVRTITDEINIQQVAASEEDVIDLTEVDDVLPILELKKMNVKVELETDSQWKIDDLDWSEHEIEPFKEFKGDQ